MNYILRELKISKTVENITRWVTCDVPRIISLDGTHVIGTIKTSVKEKNVVIFFLLLKRMHMQHKKQHKIRRNDLKYVKLRAVNL